MSGAIADEHPSLGVDTVVRGVSGGTPPVAKGARLPRFPRREICQRTLASRIDAGNRPIGIDRCADPRARVGSGSKCEKLRVSRTSPLIPYLPTCERTSTCDVMGHVWTAPRWQGLSS